VISPPSRGVEAGGHPVALVLARAIRSAPQRCCAPRGTPAGTRACARARASAAAARRGAGARHARRACGALCAGALAFVGGTLAPLGGHNVSSRCRPAAWRSTARTSANGAPHRVDPRERCGRGCAWPTPQQLRRDCFVRTYLGDPRAPARAGRRLGRRLPPRKRRARGRAGWAEVISRCIPRSVEVRRLARGPLRQPRAAASRWRPLFRSPGSYGGGALARARAFERGGGARRRHSRPRRLGRATCSVRRHGQDPVRRVARRGSPPPRAQGGAASRGHGPPGREPSPSSPTALPCAQRRAQRRTSLLVGVAGAGRAGCSSAATRRLVGLRALSGFGATCWCSRRRTVQHHGWPGT